MKKKETEDRRQESEDRRQKPDLGILTSDS